MKILDLTLMDLSKMLVCNNIRFDQKRVTRIFSWQLSNSYGKNGCYFDLLNNAHSNKNFYKHNILIISALEEYKGIDLAILSIKKLLKDFPNIKVDIYGEGSKERH